MAKINPHTFMQAIGLYEEGESTSTTVPPAVTAQLEDIESKLAALETAIDGLIAVLLP